MRFYIALAIFAFAVSAAAQTSTVSANECVRVTAVSATLRGKPSLTGKTLDMVTKDTKLESIARRDSWVLVQSDDYAGWVESKWIEPCIAGTVSKTPVLPAPQGTQAPTPALASVVNTQSSPTENRTYTRGPKGGCYYISSSGRKTYVDHSLCN